MEGVPLDGVAEVEESGTLDSDGVVEISVNEGEEGS